MKKVLMTTLMLASLSIGSVVASDDCYDPVDSWQPKENLQQSLESRGWQVNRIKVDDGCYEVKGTDSLGNRFEAIFSPASLDIRELEIEFENPVAAKRFFDEYSPSP